VKLDPVFKFDEKTAPMCMFHGSADLYSPMASTLVYRELRKRKIPAELNLFADRNHGFWGQDGKGDKATAYDNWFDRAHEFLAQMGFLGPLPPEEDLMKRFASDFHDPAKYVKEELWPKGKIPDFQEKQCVPYLEWFIPSNLTTKSIQIVYSGGAYKGNGPDGFEVAPARRFLNEKGMAVVTMKYRTPRPAAPLAKHTTAWQDLQRCIRIVRSKAAEKGLDPNRIGIMGSSAGGHLTLMTATNARTPAYEPVDAIDAQPAKLQWACPVYPAYALTDGADVPNVRGGNYDDSVPVPEFAFDADTPPMCFLHGDADSWAAMNSVKIWEKLRTMGIQSDLHTYARRGHCFQIRCAPGTGRYTWLDGIWDFLTHKKLNR
jgi:acetyl esterase/lipase